MLKRGLLDLSQPGAQDFLAAFATAEDRRYAARYRRPARSDQSVAGRALLRALLGEALALDPRSVVFSASASGRPYLETHSGLPPGLDITIAHSGDVVAAAVTDIGMIGIDVEDARTERSFAELAKKIFGSAEQDAVRHDGKQAFYRIWTLREAFAKAADQGFAGVLSRTDRFALAVDRFALDAEVRRWTFHVDRYRGAFVIALALGVAADGSNNEINAALRQGLTVFPHRGSGASDRAAAP